MTTRGVGMPPIKPMFPYFGGKRRAAPLVWSALGQVSRYVEPFFGSGAVLLGNPRPPLSELVNDRCHFVANLWRSLQQDPETVMRLASAPPSEVELKARHRWLYGEGAEQLAAVEWDDLSACVPEIGGLWLWVACVTIKVSSADLGSGHGAGIKAAGVHLDPMRRPPTTAEVCERIARVQVMCGDWARCVRPSRLLVDNNGGGSAGIFLDPPYGDSDSVHYDDGTGNVARDVWQWACDNGDNPRLRIVVAGYDDGREVPEGWVTVERSEHGGYSAGAGTDNANRHRERLGCSPHCVNAEQIDLFEVTA